MKSDPREALRVTVSMATVCALGAGVLGLLYAATDRYQRATALRTERRAIFELLDLDSSATVTEVRQFLAPGRGQVIYQAAPLGSGAEARAIAFTLDGALVPGGGHDAATAAGRPSAAGREKRVPLGRMFVARRAGTAAGFVVEGSARGYKNRIRFLVGVAPDFTIAGVRVVEHEEDPGLGAEVATQPFQGQFIGRDAASLSVTRDPMPEDWRLALLELRRMPAARWRPRHADLARRERGRPIYAVTGATISSRALGDGVRATLDHFRRRWSLIEPYLGTAS